MRLDLRRRPSLVPLTALLLTPPQQQALVATAAGAAAAAAAATNAPNWVVYCIDFAADAVVLIEIEAGADLLAEPFLDRGVCRLAGARAALVSTATLAAWVEASYGEAEGGGPLTRGLAWVWNTGR